MICIFFVNFVNSVYNVDNYKYYIHIYNIIWGCKIMKTKAIRVSLLNHERLSDIGHKNDSFNDIISKILDEYEEYQEIKDLIEADKEFANGQGIHFSSLDELDTYLDD